MKRTGKPLQGRADPGQPPFGRIFNFFVKIPEK
jgi:hypothetical protein